MKNCTVRLADEPWKAVGLQNDSNTSRHEEGDSSLRLKIWSQEPKSNAGSSTPLLYMNYCKAVFLQYTELILIGGLMV